MAAKNVDIRINTTADTQGAKQATTAMQGLNTATKQVNQTVNTTTANTGRMGQIAGQAGFQIQDFAVQVGGGTSALTAFSQQAPQLLGIFGPGGAIAGALVAVGAVATKIFLDMAKNASVAGEAMEDMSDKLKEAFGANAKKMVEEFNQGIKNQTSVIQSLRDMEVNLTEARLDRNEADANLIESQAALQTAAVKYLDATGQIVNAEKELAAIRNEAANAQREAQIQDIENQVTVARERYKAFAAQYQDVQAETDAAQKRLAELESRQAQVMDKLTFTRGQDTRSRKVGSLKEGENSFETNALTFELDALRQQIDGVYKTVQGAPQRLQEITNQAIVASSELNTVVLNAESDIAKINEQFNLTQSAQAITSATTEITQGAKEISEQIAGIEAITPVQQEAKAVIQKAVEDGKITAEEQVAIGRSLSILLAGMKTGQTESLKTVQDLILLNNEMAIKMSAMNNEINGLRERVKAIPIR
jgi:predicted  nucleic acid-binding Zn-ribbon protein